MSTEEQSNPNNPDTEVSGDRSINIKLNKTHNIANQQAEQADKQRRNLFRSLNDAINTHHFRQLVRDPRAWVEIIALIVLICYTRYAGQQSETMNNTLVEIRKQTGFAEKASKAAIDAAGIAQDALTMARDNFRQDQRPYIWLAGPKGPPYQAELLVTGEKAGHVAVTFFLH